jgi:hypothetical protein
MISSAGRGGVKRIREAKLDKLTLVLAAKDGKFIGAIFGGKNKVEIEGADADDVWRRLHDEAARANPKYFGFDGARARFLHFFPNGFHSRGFAHMEGDYKHAAKDKLDAAVPLEEAATGSGFGKAAMSVINTNLLFNVEQMRIREALRGPNADAFIRAAARFTLGEGAPALLDMERALKPHNAANWLLATYLPYLWRPNQHMLLKPVATRDFAERVGHPFAQTYEPRLDMSVYESLLDLAARTETELAGLRPRDRIDVQSFIWVVGSYDMEKHQPMP